VQQPEQWFDPSIRFQVQVRSDGDGLARDDTWAAGSSSAPPDLLQLMGPYSSSGSPVGEVITGVTGGQEVGEDEIVTLLGARGPEVRLVAEMADELRRQVVGDTVTFVKNRNINYTNVCTYKCNFCAFSKGPLSLNLRGTPYLLETEEIQRRVIEAVEIGATEVCLQGGIHPSFDGSYYLGVTRAVKELTNKFDGISLRVPVVAGSIADVTFLAARKTTVKEVNDILTKAASQKRWKDVLAVTKDPVVSSDIVGQPYGAIVDLEMTRVVDGDLVKVLSWYDNEWGYVATLVKHVLAAAKSL
jgi:hypothetical protein